jgi:hypothetical protein
MIGAYRAQVNRGRAVRYLRLSAGLAVLFALLAGSVGYLALNRGELVV